VDLSQDLQDHLPAGMNLVTHDADELLQVGHHRRDEFQQHGGLVVVTVWGHQRDCLLDLQDEFVVVRAEQPYYVVEVSSCKPAVYERLLVVGDSCLEHAL